MHTTTTLVTLALAALVSAKTDLEGCTSSQTVAYGGASMIYWVPDSGEICSFLDCGGGRAPPKTTVPGCAQYSGTASYTPDYMPGYGPNATPTATVTPDTTYIEGSATATVSPDTTYNEGSATATVSPDTTYIETTLSATGTGGGPSGNGTATFSTGNPTSSTLPTGAAPALAVGQGVLGLMGAVAGLAML